MFDFLTDFFLALTWRKILLGAAIFLVSFFANLGIVTWILVKLPADHFSKGRKTKFWAGPRPWIHAAKVIGKNIGGVLLVALGIVLSLPGVPGQGLLTVLLGIMLLDFPGRHRLEQKLLSKPSIVNSINKLRGRFGKKALELN
nr:putative transmembrane protein (PGPGW) [uncultured bacterium]